MADLKMLRLFSTVVKMERLEMSSGQLRFQRFGDKVREDKLRWFVHVQRTDRLDKGCKRWSYQP